MRITTLLACAFIAMGCEDDTLLSEGDTEGIYVTAQTRGLFSDDDDYYYTTEGISVANSGIGPETWYGGTNDFVPYMVEYTSPEDNNAVSNSIIRTSWADVEDENGYHFSEVFDKWFISAYNSKQKICFGVFTIDSKECNKIPVKVQYNGKDCTAYINYPKFVHEELMKSKEYAPRLYQNNDGSITDDSKPLYFAPDLRNPYLYEKYRELMIAFREYLDEEVEFKGRNFQRKQFVREIQIRHYGFYGEGSYPYIGPNRDTIKDISEYDMELSSDLIKYGKIYTEVFPDIRLVAPVLGMWDTTVLHEYQFWLATASNNCGEFGLFCDSWGDNGDTAIGSSVIVWNGIRLRDILMNKWRNAPIGGEPRPLFPTENFIPYSTIVKQVKLVRPAKIMSSNLTTGNEAGNTSHWAATEHEGDLFKIAYSMMGFRIILRNIRCNTSGILRREAKFTYELQNIGLTPVYEPWDIYYVFRDRKTNKEITMRKSSFDIRNLMPSDDANDVLQIRSDGWLEIEDEFNDIPRGMYDVYLRISDPDKIVPNMRLSQPGYNENGEYFIDSILI